MRIGWPETDPVGQSRMKIRTTMITMTAVLGILGVADAAIITYGNVTTHIDTAGDYTSAGLYNIANGAPGGVDIDNGSTWTYSGVPMFIGHNQAGTITISDGGWLRNTTAASNTVDAGFVFTLGNRTNGNGHVLVTGTGSQMTTLNNIRVGRRTAAIASTLTIENGGMVMANGIVYGTDAATSQGYVRVGLDGILAINGVKTIDEMAVKGAGSGALQYWNSGSSAWDDIGNATPGVHYTLAAGSDDLSGYTVLTVIPEPGTIPLLGLAGLVMLIRRRFVK